MNVPFTPAALPEPLRFTRHDGRSAFRLADHAPNWFRTAATGADFRQQARDNLERYAATLADAQELLWANHRQAVLVILQGMDASGKDGVIKQVMRGVNPQGCQVRSFQAPSAEELDHPFLWRYQRHLPERGRIGIFNRSYYEEVLIVRVHPQLLTPQRLPGTPGDEAFWQARFTDINAFEQHLSRNGTLILKFFLHLSYAEQRRRLIKRLDQPDRLWKFSLADLEERAYWPRYQQAYEAMIAATATPWAPWHIIPADHKPSARALVAAWLCGAMQTLDLQWPSVSAAERQQLAEARQRLQADPGG